MTPMSHIKKYSQCKTADYKFLEPSIIIAIKHTLYWTDLSRQIFINFASLFICRL